LGARDVLAVRVTTCAELDQALAAAQDRMVLIEAVVPRMDTPPLLLDELAQSLAATDAGQLARVRLAQV